MIIAELARRYPQKAEIIQARIARIGWTLKHSPETTKISEISDSDMKRDKLLQRLLLLQVLDGVKSPELASYSEQQQVYNSALLINDGYVEGDAIQNGSGVYVATVMIQLTQ